MCISHVIKKNEYKCKKKKKGTCVTFYKLGRMSLPRGSSINCEPVYHASWISGYH